MQYFLSPHTPWFFAKKTFLSAWVELTWVYRSPLNTKRLWVTTVEYLWSVLLQMWCVLGELEGFKNVKIWCEKNSIMSHTYVFYCLKNCLRNFKLLNVSCNGKTYRNLNWECKMQCHLSNAELPAFGIDWISLRCFTGGCFCHMSLEKSDCVSLFGLSIV